MSMSFFIAQRYLSATRGNRFLSWITILSVSGIAIGVAAMICVLSVINGFETELRRRFLAANAHILAFQFPHGVDNPSSWMTTITKDFGKEMTGISPFVHSETMATRESLLHSILVRGIVPNDREKVQSLVGIVTPITALKELQDRIDTTNNPASAYKKSLFGTPPIIIGSGLASLLSAKIGDNISLVKPEVGSEGEMTAFRVVGVYDSGLKHYDNKLGIMALTDAQNFFRLKSKVHGFEIGLRDPDASQIIASRMMDRYTITIKEWKSFNKDMFEAMQMERSVIGLLVALVAFVASFNILTTLFISVTQKQRGISVLKALGASQRQIVGVFVTQGLMIGVIGSLLGVLIAFFVSSLLSRYEFINLPDLYLLARLPVSFDPRVYLAVGIAGVAICLIAGVYPAWVAGRTNIVRGFRGGADTR